MASNNTSKTAHVMNLLSKNRGGESPAEPQKEIAPQTETVSQPVPQAEAEPAHAAPVAPIISSINADAAVSAQIKGALEAELEETPAPAPQQAAPAPQPPVQEAAPAQKTAPVREAAPAPAEAPAEAPVEEAMDLPVFHDEPPAEDDASYVNVMQILVEEKADEYMKMFGICCCDKCRVDVRAFALNHLHPKYVVMSEHERVPRLTVYENRFASDVTAQLIQACKQVMLTPHHSRDEN